MLVNRIYFGNVCIDVLYDILKKIIIIIKFYLKTLL